MFPCRDPTKDQASLLPITKSLSSLSSGSPQLTTYTGVNWPSVQHPMELGAWGKNMKNTNILATGIDEINKFLCL